MAIRIDHDQIIEGPEGQFYNDIMYLRGHVLRMQVYRPQRTTDDARVSVWTGAGGWQEVWQDTEPHQGTITAVVGRMYDRAQQVLCPQDREHS